MVLAGSARGWRTAAILAVILGNLAAPAMAEGEDLAGFVGRWKSQQGTLALEISRCGEGICGVLVQADGTCGARVLEAAPKVEPAVSGTPATIGRLALPGSPVMQARLFVGPRGGGEPLLTISAAPGSLSPFARTIPFHHVLARTGAPACAERPAS